MPKRENPLSVLEQVIKSGKVNEFKNMITLTGGAANMEAISPLLLTLRYDQDEMSVYLLENTSTTIPDSDGEDSPIYLAARDHKWHLVDLMLSRGAKYSDNKCMNTLTPFMRAVNQSQWDIADRLLKRGANINARDSVGQTALHAAVIAGDLKKVKYLVSHGAKVSGWEWWQNSPQDEAKKYRYDEIEAYLEKHGVNFLKTLKHRLFCKKKLSLTMRKEELDYRSEIHVLTHQDELQSAIERDDLEEVKKLANSHVDLNHVLKNDCTPLTFAIEKKRDAIIEYLINAGVNLNEEDNNLNVPILLAAQLQEWGVVQRLAMSGANVNVRDQDSYLTPLHYVMNANEFDLADMLINKKAWVNARDFHGNTMLHLAASNGLMQCVRYLMSHGANLNIRNDDKKTPKMLAEANHYFSVADYLDRHGGQYLKTLTHRLFGSHSGYEMLSDVDHAVSLLSEMTNHAV